MAGVLIHLAMGDPDKMGDPEHMTSENRAYVIGLLLPDIAKLDFVRTKEDFDRLFDGCEAKDILTYEEFVEYSKNPHFTGNKRWTNNPNLKEMVDCPSVDLRKPVWQGVLCHNIGDKGFYYKNYCINDSKIREDFAKEGLEDAQWMQSETAHALYGKDGDYNLLNKSIEDEFNVSRFLPKELREKFGVGFSKAENKPTYMNLNNIRKYIYYTRLLAKHVDSINIAKVLDFFDNRDKGDELGAI